MTPPPPHPPSPPLFLPTVRRPAWPAAVLVALYLLAALPLILSGAIIGRGGSDQINYHEKVIRGFMERWPRPDFSDYLSMTTPGYHAVIAAVGAWVDGSRTALQLTGAVFTIGLLGLLGMTLALRMPPFRALAVGMTVAASLYVFSAGVWLLPDNAAWLGVLGVLLVALSGELRRGGLVIGGAVLLALVLVRQVHLWAAAVLWAAAWAGHAVPSGGSRTDPSGERSVWGWRDLFTALPDRAQRLTAAVICTIPAFAAVGWFIRAWGGLTPPTFKAWTGPPNPAAPAFVLALLGLVSVFYAGYLAGPLTDLWLRRRGLLLGFALGGLVIAAAPHTSYDYTAGRGSGIWNIVKIAPVVTDRSPLLIAWAVMGAIALAGWMQALPWRDRWVMLAALVGFTAAQTASPWVWQRYVEPMVLIACAVMAGRVSAAETGRGEGDGEGRIVGAARTAGPLALAALLAATTAYQVWRSTPAAPYDPPTEIGRPEPPP